MTRIDKLDGRTRVSRVTEALTKLSLAAADGDHLGGEDELIERLGISRPTLRQAAKIVESDSFISIRRGVRGGIYAARPGAADVIRAPARYLRLQGTTVAQLHAATKAMAHDMAAAAAECDDAALRAQLELFRLQIDTHDTVADMIRAETDLARLLAEMSGNPAAKLFIEIGYTFGRDERHLHFYQLPEDRERARALQRGLCDAVLARDPDIARLMMQRRSELIGEWLAREEE